MSQSSLGPVVAGFIYQALGWRWVNWIMVILAFVCAVMMSSIKETMEAAILYQRYRHCHQQDRRYWSQHEVFGARISLWPNLVVNTKRIFSMAVAEPIWQVITSSSSPGMPVMIRRYWS